METSERLLQEAEKLKSENSILMERLQKKKVLPPMIKRLSSCTNDIYNFTPVVIQYYDKADSEFRKRERHPNHAKPYEHLELLFHDSDVLIRPIAPIFKSYFFFVRALQDCFAAILLASRDQFPIYPSMTKKIINKTETDLYVELQKNIPGYVEWFLKFKSTRDRIKQGVGQGFEFNNATGVMIRFYIMKKDEKVSSGFSNDIEERINLDYFTTCLKFSTQMTTYLSNLAA